MSDKATLHFLSGKMAAGKSTLAKVIARQCNGVLLVEDDYLADLFPGEIRNIQDYIKYSARVKQALEGLIHSLVSRGVSVVLDFPGNTLNQRKWFRRIIEVVGTRHELHYVDASDDLCKIQLKERSANLPGGTAFTSEAEFDAVTSYFQPPLDEEGFNIVRHTRV